MGINMRKILYALISCGLLLVHGLAVAATNGYCDSNSLNSFYGWQGSVAIGNVVVNSGNNGGYNYVTDSGLALESGDNIIQLAPGYRSYNYPVHWRGWLDLNGDNQFSQDEQLFETTSRGAVTVTATLPQTFQIATATLRIAMKYGSYPAACEVYTYGETEDLVVALPQPPAPLLEDTYHLKLDHDFKLHRNGAIGDDVGWVIEKNGTVILSRGADSELEYRYFANSQGDDYRVWLEQFVDGAYQRVSNIVEYTPGTSDRYELQLSEGYQINRSGILGETGTLTWVIEMDGSVVLERLATDELNYIYYRNWSGTRFRVWLKQFINGQYEVVSNTVEYQPNQTAFNLTLDQKYKFTRDGQPGDPVRWIVEQDGLVIVDRDASAEMEFTFIESQPGSRYRIWLSMNVDGQDQVVSNVVSYDEPTVYAYELGLEPNYKITRSGNLGESLSWVIVKDDDVVLQRNATNELSYTYFNNTNGSYFQVYLLQNVGGYYQRVSNIIRYEVKDFGYSLNVDAAYQLTRSGELGESLFWIIEENGQPVLQQDASVSLSYTYPGNTPGAGYRAWLAMAVDATLRPVSNAVSYQVPEDKPPLPAFTLELTEDYRIVRDGAIGDPVRWMVEENGVVVFSQYAGNTFDFTYPDHQPNAEYRIWLADDISGEIVSNEILYEYVESISYSLTLNEDYSVDRSGELGQPLEWVLWENGVERWREDATYQPGFYFPDHVIGNQYQVFLVYPPTQEVLSEVLTYTYVMPGTEYTLTFDSDNLAVTRSGLMGDPLSWIVEENGVVIGDFSSSIPDFVYPNNTPGANYRIWLVFEGSQKPVSNIISYQVPDQFYDYAIELNTDGTITRSGALGDEVELVFLENGQINWGMDASQDLVLSFPFLPSGSYQAYLIPWGQPSEQVSNALGITVP